jgi:hypothetical protein
MPLPHRENLRAPLGADLLDRFLRSEVTVAESSAVARFFAANWPYTDRPAGQAGDQVDRIIATFGREDVHDWLIRVDGLPAVIALVHTAADLCTAASSVPSVAAAIAASARPAALPGFVWAHEKGGDRLPDLSAWLVSLTHGRELSEAVAAADAAFEILLVAYAASVPTGTAGTITATRELRDSLRVEARTAGLI